MFRIKANGPGFSSPFQREEQVPVVSNLQHLQYMYLLVTGTDHVTASVGQGKACPSLASKHLLRCIQQTSIEMHHFRLPLQIR
jgi:hypothetical protein